MPGSVPSKLNPGVPLAPSPNWRFLAAGTYDFVTLSGGACAVRVVALAAGNWTATDYSGNDSTSAVPSGFSHVGLTRGITTDQPIAVYY